MANAYSVPQSMGQYVEPVNLNLVNAALSSKQQKYDYNVAKIDSLLSEFGNVDLVRDEDKKYLSDRIDAALLSVNQIQQRGDLSKNNLTREITNQVTSVIDDRVLEQASNTKRYRAFEQSVAERREKKPESYSDINYSFARQTSGLNDYLENKSDSFNNLQYVEYKDVNKRINDLVLDLNSKSPEQVIETPFLDENGLPTGYMIKKTKKNLTPDEIRSVAESQLDASFMQQVEINGWYNSNGYDQKVLGENLDSILGGRVRDIDSQILKLKRDKDNGIADSTADVQIQSLENSKVNVQKNISNYKSNPKQASLFIEKERVLNSAVDTFGRLYTESVSYTADEAFYKQQNLVLEQAKLKYQMEKDAGLTGSGAIGEAFTTVVPTDTPEDPQSYQQSIDSQITEASTAATAIREDYIGALQNEAGKGNQEAANFLKEYDNMKAKKKAGETDSNVFDNLIASTTYKDKLNILGDVNFRHNLKEAQDKEKLLISGLNEAQTAGMNEHIDSTYNSKGTIKAFFDNKGTSLLWKGKKVPVWQVLQQQGIADSNGNKIGDIKKNPELRRAIEQSYYADDVLSNRDGWSKNDTDAEESLKKLAISLGEDPKKAYRSWSTRGSELSTGEGKKWFTPNPGSKTAQFLAQAEQNGIYDTWGFADQSLSSDDATINNFLKSDYKQTESYKNKIKTYYNNLPSTQQLSIPATDKANFERLRGYMGITSADVNKNNPITISKKGNNVVLTQAHSEGSGEKKSTTPIQITIPQDEFNRNFTALGGKLNFNNEAAFYTTDKLRGQKLISEPIKYFSKADYKTLSYVNNAALGNEQARAVFGGYLTETDTYNNLYRGHQKLSKRGAPGEFDTLLKNAVSKDNANKFSVNMVVDRDYSGEPILQVNLVSTTGENIHSEVIRGNDNVTNFKTILDTAPQAYYGMMLDSIFAEEEQLMLSGSTARSEGLTKLAKYL